MHIEMDDDVVRQIDVLAGQRGRTRFVREAILSALDQRRRAEMIRSAQGTISSTGHDWDGDPAAWVHAQRRSQPRRVG